MLVKCKHYQHPSCELIAHSKSILAAVTTDVAKGIKTNPYAPRTGDDDPSVQTRTRSSHQQSTLICRCITDDSDTYPCPVSSDPFLSVIQGVITYNTLRCRCIADDPDT